MFGWGNVEYILITLLAISATTFIIYMLANKVFGVLLRLKSLVLCAICALVISVVLPRIVVSFAGLAGTVGFLAVFAVIFAYLVAYYDDPSDLQPTTGATASGAALNRPDPAAGNIAETILELPSSVELPLYSQQSVLSADGPPAPEPLAAVMVQPASELEQYLPHLPEPPPAAEYADTDLQPLPETENTVDLAGMVFGTAAGADLSTEPDPEPGQPTAGEEPDQVREEGQVYSFSRSVKADPESPFLPPEEAEPDQDLPADTPLEMLQLAPLLGFVPAGDHEPQPLPVTAAESEPVSQPEAEPQMQPVSPAKAKSKPKAKKTVPEPEPEALSEAVMTPVSDPEADLPEPSPAMATASPRADSPPETEHSAPVLAAPEPGLDILPAAENPPENQEVTAITTPSDLSPVSDSLDDLLDFAFSQKEQCNHPLALDTFRQALKLYQDTEAAPYIAIEIAALLKERGAYDEAIMLLTQTRNLPGLAHNDLLSQEFITTIAYLRIVKNILLESRMGYIPFSSIPTEVSQEIDAEFREWRNLA
jgi:hypothetical protein